jgi:hypothetical protein
LSRFAKHLAARVFSPQANDFLILVHPADFCGAARNFLVTHCNNVTFSNSNGSADRELSSLITDM